MAAPSVESEFGPWNPGLKSVIPRTILPLSTMFRSENVATAFSEAHELSDFSGLSAFELVAFRPERLVAHEILIRVTADLTVPDGPNYEDLGINLRGMAATILNDHVRPHFAELVQVHERLRSDTLRLVAEELDAGVFRPNRPAARQSEPSSFLSRLMRPKRVPTPAGAAATPTDRTAAALADWSDRAQRTDDRFEKARLEALVRVVGAFVGSRGRLIADRDLIARLAATLVCNGLGSEILGETIEPIFARACQEEGYRVLPAQAGPVIMNVKGASASGKSTMRSLQQKLAGRLGVPWEDFALISPDYWRKFLLDYDSLGPVYKYGAALTGHELAVIDKKLDRYMARKARQGRMSHLLIDRFRFDSFSPEEDREEATNLLTRFGETIFLFFVVTPPDATVERAWVRGLRTGRYKAVDDLLFHNVEAFTGMPQLFFSWALSKGKRVHYEFLDNSVAEGELPRTIASGWNGEMNVYDVAGMLNIDRYKKIDVDASSPGEVYDPEARLDDRNLHFLSQCVERMDHVYFVDPASGETYGVVAGGRWNRRDETALALSPETRRVLEAVASGPPGEQAGKAGEGGSEGPDLDEERTYVVGAL